LVLYKKTVSCWVAPDVMKGEDISAATAGQPSFRDRHGLNRHGGVVVGRRALMAG
jgi:hypothetical protein